MSEHAIAAGRNMHYEGQHAAEDPADTVARLALVQKLRACTEAEAQAMALILQHEAVIERLRWALAGVLELHDASRAPGQFSEPLAWARVRLALRAQRSS